MKRLLLSHFLFLISYFSFSQNVGIGTTTPNANAILEINSSTKGILIPRTSTTTRLTIPVTKGLQVYDTTSSSFWFNDGTNWTEALNGNNGWGIKGNSNTNPSINFIGTADNQSLRFRLNNNWAGEWNRTTRNYSMGAGAMQSVGTGTGNIAIGSGAIGSNGIANGIVAIGDSALYNQNSFFGISNVAIGRKALFANNDGSNNTAVGYLSLVANTNGRENTAIGSSALNQNTIGNYNVALGAFALNSNKLGNSNIAIGKNALFADTTGSANIAVGTAALGKAFNGSDNIAIGDSALYNSGTNFLSRQNTAIGSDALFSNINGAGLTAVGYGALRKFDNVTGYSTAVGAYSQLSVTTGQYNTSIGAQSLIDLTSGEENTAAGVSTLLSCTTGSDNTAIGLLSLNSVTTGYYNTGLGKSSDVSTGSLDYATAIGAYSEVGCSNCMALGGNASSTRTKVGINQSTPFTDLHIIQQSDNGLDKTRGIRIQRSTGTNQWRTLIDPSNNYIFEYNNSLYSYIEPAGGAFVNPSDERLKKNIEPLDNVLDKVMLLQARTYQYNLTDTVYSNTRLTGFIAQDVEKIFPEFVHTGQNGYRGIAYHNFGIIAVKAIQEQQQMISTLRNENEELKKEIKLIKEKLGL